MSNPTPMDRHTFYTGLMLALNTFRDRFQAEGPRFHEAFRSTIEYVRQKTAHHVQGIEWMMPDPVFGVVHEATEMLLEAEQDMLVSLFNPHLREAQFKLTSEQAAKELRELPDPDWFLDLAKRFNEQLEA